MLDLLSFLAWLKLPKRNLLPAVRTGEGSVPLDQTPCTLPLDRQ